MMKAKDVETILQQVQRRYENICETQSRHNDETDESKKSEHKQEADTQRVCLFAYVKKHKIDGSPSFTEMEQFSEWEKYVKALIDKLSREETAEQKHIKKDEHNKLRLKEERNKGLCLELLFFLRECAEYENSKHCWRERGMQRCAALKICQEKVRKYFTDAVADQNDFDTICNDLAGIIRNTLSRVKIALEPKNYWENLKVFFITDNPIIDALQEKEER